MDEKEGLWILVVFIFLTAIPLSNGFEGNSQSYDVVVSDFSMAGFEDTNPQPNDSIEIDMDAMPIGEGNSSSDYTLLLGLSKILGPIAFNISDITPHSLVSVMPIAKADSIVNCTGVNAFSHNNFEMPKHYYRFTDGINNISTNWSESSILDCLSVGGCNEPNLTCHFKVDDSHMNSTEITKTIIVDTTNPVITLISPANDTKLFINNTWTFTYNVTDEHIVESCELIINQVSVQNISLPQQNTTLNFTYYLEQNVYAWNVNCTDEARNEVASEIWLLKTFDEKFWIENIGVTGFENISRDYTYSRDVVLKLIIPNTINYCRFSNNLIDWGNWQPCEPFSHWILFEGDGNKTVYTEINHSCTSFGIITNFSDWIILESNATHLDVTPPENFTVYDEGEFTNKNDTLHFWWDMPADPETEIFGGQITFTYILKDENGTYITNWSAPSQSLLAEIANLSLAENITYILVVNATNPSGLTTASESDGIKLDMKSPAIISVFGNPDNSSWSNNNNLSFNWNADDSISGVAGYSMILDTFNDTIADEIPEDYINNRTYTSKDEGIYYFHIRPYDNAGNFGETFHYGPVKIDLTPPSEPTPLNPIELAVSNQIIFYWQASTDALSGIKQYNITITDNTTGADYNYSTPNINYTFGVTEGRQYFLIVTAIDNAGNEKSSVLPQTLQLQIISARPDNSAIVAGEPIIKVETNKAAICKEDYTNENFLFTDSKYHETRLVQGDGGPYPLVITCKDSDGFYATETINYEIDSAKTSESFTIEPINDTYIGKTVNATITGIGLGQINREKFMVYIDDVELSDFTINDIDDAGEYSLQFTAKEAGPYTLKVVVDGIEGVADFTINSLNLNVEYTGTSGGESESHLAYAATASNKKVGIASDSKQVTPDAIANKIMLNSSAEGKTYLFFTKNNFNAKTKDSQLKNNEFSKNTNAFGYPADDDYRIKTSLEYNTLIIQGLKELPNGVYSLFVKNMGQNSKNQTVIMVELE